MAYVSVLWNGTLAQQAFARDKATIVYTWIGYDSVTQDKYHQMVELYPSTQGTEFAFATIVEDSQTRKLTPLFDSAVSNGIVPKSYRQQLLQILLQTTERIIRGSNAASFYMVTFVDHLPVQALVKYDLLCNIFEQCGYDVTHTEPTPGGHFWLMNRRTP